MVTTPTRVLIGLRSVREGRLPEPEADPRSMKSGKEKLPFNRKNPRAGPGSDGGAASYVQQQKTSGRLQIRPDPGKLHSDMLEDETNMIK